MTMNKIIGDACKSAHSLWEEVFSEDSKQFTDYYFENKAEKNIGYVIGQAPYDAMMFRTPYQLQIGQKQREISYIVGVATREECRHKGYMRALLNYAMKEMYEEKNPFTFLMPANPAIYEPFDFAYVYERDVWELKEPEKRIPYLESLTLEENGRNAVYDLIAAEKDGRDGDENQNLYEMVFLKKEHLNVTGLYSVRSLQRQFPEYQIMNQLADFANDYLKKHYHIYVHRDDSYYEMQLKESAAQNGDIYVLLEKGIIKAFFVYAREEGEVFLQEVLEDEEGRLEFLRKTEQKKPIIMARIIHLEEMMKLVCSRDNITTIIEVKDELIPENEGIYQWEITPLGSRVQKVCSSAELQKENESKAERLVIPEVSMHIKEFAVRILTGVFINEIV